VIDISGTSGVNHAENQFSCQLRLYTEMDFRNEAANAQRMQQLLSESEHGRSASVLIPQPVLQHTTR
jgi:predicted unusual protein kinase regulating ubiquinone biosynthesis (AarF/ABC1/UbiB family)